MDVHGFWHTFRTDRDQHTRWEELSQPRWSHKRPRQKWDSAVASISSAIGGRLWSGTLMSLGAWPRAGHSCAILSLPGAWSQLPGDRAFPSWTSAWSWLERQAKESRRHGKPAALLDPNHPRSGGACPTSRGWGGGPGWAHSGCRQRVWDFGVNSGPPDLEPFAPLPQWEPLKGGRQVAYPPHHQLPVKLQHRCQPESKRWPARCPSGGPGPGTRPHGAPSGHNQGHQEIPLALVQGNGRVSAEVKGTELQSPSYSLGPSSNWSPNIPELEVVEKCW